MDQETEYKIRLIEDYIKYHEYRELSQGYRLSSLFSMYMESLKPINRKKPEEIKRRIKKFFPQEYRAFDEILTYFDKRIAKKFKNRPSRI